MAKLTIMLHRDVDTGQWFVERVEVERNRIRTQTRFGVPYPMHLAFAEEFNAYLLTVLPDRMDPSALVIEQKEFPELSLSLRNLKVIAQRALAGLQSVSIRVHDAVGSLSRIYSQRLASESGQAAPDHLLSDN